MKAFLTEYNQDDDAQNHVAHESLHFVLDEQNSLSDAEGSGDKQVRLCQQSNIAVEHRLDEW